MIRVMEKMSENYVKNAKEARKENRKIHVFDVTIGGAMGFLDPVSKWEKIEIKGRREKGLSLMGVWEGLKVYKNKEGVDKRFFEDERMLGKIRDCKSYGKLIGIRSGDEILNVEDGIEYIFKRRYKEEVMNRFGNVIEKLKEMSKKEDFVLLDYKKEDRKIPISHAEVLKEIIEE